MAKGSLIDVLASSVPRTQTVAERIERRLTVLGDWLQTGIPSGKSVPKSLTAARMWHDLELGILSISSPNEFTTTHHVHGSKVRKLADLLGQLRSRFGKPKRPVRSQSASAARPTEKVFQAQLEAAVSQWHSERDQRLTEMKAAEAAENRSRILLDEKDRLIAKLRHQLLARDGIRTVE